MHLPYRLTDRIGTRATLGLIALQTDETIEPELHRIFAATDVALYVSRVPSAPDVTPETLATMADELPRAAGLLPPSLSFDAIGYGCTSGATIIGPDRVAKLISGAANMGNSGSVTNPLTAILAALQTLGGRRIGMVTPYIESVTAPMRNVLISNGFEVPKTVSFDEAIEAKVARIDPGSIAEAAIEVGKSDVDVVFLSCTNLRTLDVIDQIEATLGKPVISSNQALAWHMARLSGASCAVRAGRLMRDYLPVNHDAGG